MIAQVHVAMAWMMGAFVIMHVYLTTGRTPMAHIAVDDPGMGRRARFGKPIRGRCRAIPSAEAMAIAMAMATALASAGN